MRAGACKYVKYEEHVWKRVKIREHARKHYGKFSQVQSMWQTLKKTAQMQEKTIKHYEKYRKITKKKQIKKNNLGKLDSRLNGPKP